MSRRKDRLTKKPNCQETRQVTRTVAVQINILNVTKSKFDTELKRSELEQTLFKIYEPVTLQSGHFCMLNPCITSNIGCSKTQNGSNIIERPNIEPLSVKFDANEDSFIISMILTF